MAIVICSCTTIFRGKRATRDAKLHIRNNPSHRILGVYTFSIPYEVRVMLENVSDKDLWFTRYR